jgi:glycosyltransferase involved in cell wall biosynthesis
MSAGHVEHDADRLLDSVGRAASSHGRLRGTWDRPARADSSHRRYCALVARRRRWLSKESLLAENPVMSVIVCSYRGRSRIGPCLQALTEQDLSEPYEIIAVASGDDGWAKQVRERFSSVRVLDYSERLNPGRARNVGLAAARGEYVAFIPDDGRARSDWLRRRLRRHRAGFEVVGGAIVNGTPRHAIGTADYYIEYSALLPSLSVLRNQPTPYSLSYSRELIMRLGPYAEDVDKGEDTLLNRRCVEAGVTISYEPAAQFAHLNLTRIRAFVRHHYEHGRGLVQCVHRYGYRSRIGGITQSRLAAAYAMFVRNPLFVWCTIARRSFRAHPARLVVFLSLAPLVWLGLLSRSVGAWLEWRAIRAQREIGLDSVARLYAAERQLASDSTRSS